MNFINKLSIWYFSRDALPYWGILALDLMIVVCACLTGVYVGFGGGYLAGHFWTVAWGTLVTLPVFVAAFRVFHTYNGILRYSSFVDLQHVFLANLAALLLVFLVAMGVQWGGGETPVRISLTSTLVAFVFATLFMWLVRVLVKVMFDTTRTRGYTRRAFIYGVREGGIALGKQIQNESPRRFLLAGFVSSESHNQQRYVMGVHVYPDAPGIVDIIRDAHARVLIVSPTQSAHFRQQQALITDLIAADIKILMMPDLETLDPAAPLSHRQLHEVEIEDLLPRDPIQVDMQAIGRMLEDRTLLITGAAGSIGSEMVRQAAKFCPRRMILVDQAETPMHDLRLMMAQQFPRVEAHTIVASITNQAYMDHLFQTFRPDYVFHAAAYKHVPMMEDNPVMAVENNIVGTRVIADLSVRYGTRKFVMISTDKAVNPTNVMGCSKRICEIYCQSLAKAIAEGHCPIETADGQKPRTQFVTTRFGNVLGSNGSVIPIFKRQIKQGGPVTVTHPDIIRFFMLIPEACRLVLEAGTMGRGGEIFVFDMGQPVRIADLARRLIALSGVDGVEIKYTGLRDGEKLYEEVLSDEENTTKTPNPKIMVARVREYDYADALAAEQRLLAAAQTLDDMAVVREMKRIVPEYKSRHSKYEALDE